MRNSSPPPQRNVLQVGATQCGPHIVNVNGAYLVMQPRSFMGSSVPVQPQRGNPPHSPAEDEEGEPRYIPGSPDHVRSKWSIIDMEAVERPSQNEISRFLGAGCDSHELVSENEEAQCSTTTDPDAEKNLHLAAGDPEIEGQEMCSNPTATNAVRSKCPSSDHSAYDNAGEEEIKSNADNEDNHSDGGVTPPENPRSLVRDAPEPSEASAKSLECLGFFNASILNMNALMDVDNSSTSSGYTTPPFCTSKAAKRRRFVKLQTLLDRRHEVLDGRKSQYPEMVPDIELVQSAIAVARFGVPGLADIHLRGVNTQASYIMDYITEVERKLATILEETEPEDSRGRRYLNTIRFETPWVKQIILEHWLEQQLLYRNEIPPEDKLE